MHQLTKDPSAFGGPATSSSPQRVMTRYELVRYLSYCSEMLSLAARLPPSTPRRCTTRTSSRRSAT
ncbi:MAG: hypothetical protein WDN31_12330 [Hyphomicrobium sp.]